MPMLERLLALVSRIAAGDGEAVEVLKRLIWSAAVAVVIALTPTKTDDELLDLLRGLFPK